MVASKTPGRPAANPVRIAEAPDGMAQPVGGSPRGERHRLFMVRRYRGVVGWWRGSILAWCR